MRPRRRRIARRRRWLLRNPGPICVRCGHVLCPCCPEPWCDTFVGGDDETEACCDGACAPPPGEVARWMPETLPSGEEIWRRAANPPRRWAGFRDEAWMKLVWKAQGLQVWD